MKVWPDIAYASSAKAIPFFQNKRSPQTVHSIGNYVVKQKVAH